MEEFNSHGWSGLHEACYKGYINAVGRYIEHTRKNPSKLEQRTIDDYKATPLLIAALGGHLDMIELLIKNGADLSAKLDFRGVKHGLVEVAIVREDLPLLAFAYDVCPDAARRVLTSMGLERLDMETRASIGKTIQHLAVEYPGRIEIKPELDI